MLAVNRWSTARCKREFTGTVFVDMSKAFDRVKHERLVTVLFSLGIAGTALEWFTDYLSGRFQLVKVLDSVSEAVSCSRGVPQGSVLGPLLFVPYTSELHTILPPSVQHQEFADDIVIDCSHSDPAVVCRTLTQAMTNLATWLEDIGLLLNTSKTPVLFIRPRGAAAIQPEVFCNGEKLCVIHTAQYLGLVLDNDLSWAPHVEYIGRKTARTIGQPWRHGRGLSLLARRTWFLSMILSQLCYGSNSFFPGLSAHLLGQLVKMFKAGICATLQQRLLTPTAPLLSLLSIVSLPHTSTHKIVVFVHRCINSSCSPLLQQLFTRMAPETVPEDQGTTRGQVSNLLQVPFLGGPAGRSTMMFRGRILWNALPSNF